MPEPSSSSSLVPVEITGMPSEIVTGYTIPVSDSTIGPTITVEVEPPDMASLIDYEFDGEERAEIVDWSYDIGTGQISFKVKGCSTTPPDEEDGDTMLNLTYEGEVITFAPVIVVVPTTIGSPHPQPNSDVTPQNLVMDPSSTPPKSDLGPDQVYLCTAWMQELTIPVVDQFGDSLSDLYDGQPVEENRGSGWNPINQNVSGGSYTDFVGLLWSRLGQSVFTVTDPPDPIVTNWPSATPPNSPNIPSTLTEEVGVKIGGHELDPSITNRTWIHTLPNHIQIIWP